MSTANSQNQQIVDEFRANSGKVGGYFAGSVLLLLTTTGAKTGQQSVSPLLCTVDGDRLIVYALAGGGPSNPAWYDNVVANPEVTAEVGVARFAARATGITGADRDRLWAEQVARVPSFGAYERNTTRVIPVVALERIP